MELQGHTEFLNKSDGVQGEHSAKVPCGKGISTDEDIEARSKQGRKVKRWKRVLFMNST